jgi:hypothetical protein
MVVVAVLVLAGGGWVVTRSGSSHAATPTAAPSTAATLVTPATAAQVVKHYWRVHEHALVTRNLPALARLSTGAARRWEQAAVSCGCLRVTSPRPLQETSYFVPRQTRYPASFVAAAETNVGGTPWAELLVFTKRSATAAWQVSEDSGFGPPKGEAPELGDPVSDGEGYDLPVSAAQHSRAVRVAARFAAVWQHAKDTGRVPTTSGFQMTGQTGARVAELAAFPQGHIQDNGAIGRFRFSTSRSDHLVEVADGPDDLACQPVHETVRYTAPAGRMIGQDNARTQWGPSLPPGVYRTVVSRDVWQTCFLIPPTAGVPIGVTDQDVGGAIVSPPASPTV